MLKIWGKLEISEVHSPRLVQIALSNEKVASDILLKDPYKHLHILGDSQWIRKMLL